MADDLRHRAMSFGTNAEQYDESRPTYPPRLIHDLLAEDPATILDVGCGTGKAARLLTGPGRVVVGVEPDARMAAIAAGHGLHVEVSAFEAWDAAGRQFDLLTSGQAWHWVDPVAGAAKAADVLVGGGRFAAFWNSMHHGPDVRAVLEDVYGRLAPDLLVTSVALGADATITGRADAAGAALAAAAFTDVDDGRRAPYEWTAEYTAPEWIGLLQTHSDHEILPPEVRAALLGALEVRLAELGPTFVVNFRTDLLRARRL
jgi:SAM-dependent methyltransferase